MAATRQSMERRLIEVIGNAHAFDDLDEFRSGVLPLLREAIPCDIASYNEVDDDPERMWGVSDPPLVDPEAPQRWARLSHEHPVLQYIRRTRAGRP